MTRVKENGMVTRTRVETVKIQTIQIQRAMVTMVVRVVTMQIRRMVVTMEARVARRSLIKEMCNVIIVRSLVILQMNVGLKMTQTTLMQS
jgi:hypothetical protein